MEQGRNSLGNTRFMGLTNRFVFYYIADPGDVLHYGNEVKTFSDLRAGIGGSDTNLAGDASPAMIYAGKSYHSLCAAVTSPAGDVPSYRTAYDAFELPIYLCPCGVDGAIQLRVMLQPDYRKRIIKSAYTPRAIKPPSPRFGDSDGTLGGEPLVLGVDMDLHRLDPVKWQTGMYSFLHLHCNFSYQKVTEHYDKEIVKNSRFLCYLIYGIREENSMSKRIFSIALSIALIISLGIVPAIAAETVPGGPPRHPRQRNRTATRGQFENTLTSTCGLTSLFTVDAIRRIRL